MNELIMLKIRNLIAAQEMNRASADRETAQFGGWSCDYEGRHNELQRDIDVLFAELVGTKNQKDEQLVALNQQSDLRERLVCAALTGMLANSNFSHSPSEMGEWADRYAYEAIAAMRKENTNG